MLFPYTMKPKSGAVVPISNIAPITFMLHIILFTNHNKKELFKNTWLFLSFAFSWKWLSTEKWF